MVGHETVGKGMTKQLLYPFPQIQEGVLTMLVVGEHHWPVMPLLNHMMGKVRQNDSAAWARGYMLPRPTRKLNLSPFPVFFFFDLYHSGTKLHGAAL